MKLDEELAELIGAILGDGCLSKYWSNSENHFRYEIAFTGASDDVDYYKEFIIPIFKKNFGTHGRLIKRKGENAVRFHVKNKRVFSYFQELGLPVGKKPKTMEIPEEIFKNKDLSLACVRGIWDTDGCIYLRYRKQYAYHTNYYGDYLILQLKMNAQSLLEQVKTILQTEGIKCSRIYNEKNTTVFRIVEQKSIKSFLSKIGFRNRHHIARLERFKVTNLNLFS